MDSLLLIPLIYQDPINGIPDCDNNLVIIGLMYFKIHCRHLVSYKNEFDYSNDKFTINDALITKYEKQNN